MSPPSDMLKEDLIAEAKIISVLVWDSHRDH